MFHAGQHDLIALKAGAAERINEMAVQLIRFEVSFVGTNRRGKRSRESLLSGGSAHRLRRCGSE